MRREKCNDGKPRAVILAKASIQFILLLVLTVTILKVIAVDEDSANLFERGILNFLHYQKIMLSDNVFKIEITEEGIKTANLDVPLASRDMQGTLIFENKDKATHRIIFRKHIGNTLTYDIKSPVIQPGERWAVDFLNDGIFPFECTIHPDKIHGTLQVWYEEEDFF